jgi:hypothetical protein
VDVRRTSGRHPADIRRRARTGRCCPPDLPGYTFDDPTPSGRIDSIFVESARVDRWSQVQVIFDQPYQGTWLSDHRARQ